MGIKSGKQYIEGLRDDRHIYVNGELIRDVTKYPPFQRAMHELARIYDRQSEAAYRDALTYPSPTTSQPVSSSFLIPSTFEEVQWRMRGERTRAELTNGMMGRLPDYTNAEVADLAAIRGLLGRNDSRFGDNAWNYYELCREKDLTLTHTLVDPQIDRSKGIEAQEGLRIVKETGAGLVLTGARMLSTLAPISDEILVAPYMPRKPNEEQYAMVFALPVATPGLKFICRETYDAGRCAYDRPLSSRYDEGDAIAVFDDVLVPWERVFGARDVDTYNLISPTIPGFLLLQAAIRGVVKLRFMTGVANLVAKAVGRSEMIRYQEMLGALAANVELAEGLLIACAHEIWENVRKLAENGGSSRTAPPTSFIPGLGSMYGVPGKTLVNLTLVRIFLPAAHSQAVETIRMMGSSGLIMTPTEKDFQSPELRDVLRRYLRGASMPAEDRVQIMKLAWDAIGEQFGSRALLYEWFFAGDPINNRILYYRADTNVNCTAMAQAFVDSLKQR
jgi:aromatic ring hydroxylase